MKYKILLSMFASTLLSCNNANQGKNASDSAPLKLIVHGDKATALKFENWTFERMNGDNPVYSGKITYISGTADAINASCYQDGMKSLAHLIFDTNIKHGESAKGELHCAQIRSQPDSAILEIN